MKKYIFTFFILCYFNNNSQSKLSNDTLHWNTARPISWNDFNGEAIEGIGFIGEIFCMNSASFEKKNDSKKTNYIVTAILDRNKTWIDPKLKSAGNLVYFQEIFDIYEIHARKLRKEFAQSDPEADPNEIFQKKYNDSMTDLMKEFNEFRKETKLGRDGKELKRWRIKIDEELLQLQNYIN
jgi:hypothetical protein